MKKISNYLWGVVFIIVGLVWGLNALGITNINIFFKGWWTLFIIVPSFIGLFKEGNKTGSIIFFCIGLLLLLSYYNLVSFGTLATLFVPIVFIAIGLGIIFNDAINQKINKKIKELNKDGLEEYAATFGEQKVDFREDEEFKGAALNAIFGGVEFDLRNAKIEKEQIINASAIFGGITIITPQNVSVRVRSTPIFGGVSNKVPIVKGEELPTIYISAFCMFGGVDIK